MQWKAAGTGFAAKRHGSDGIESVDESGVIHISVNWLSRVGVKITEGGTHGNMEFTGPSRKYP